MPDWSIKITPLQPPGPAAAFQPLQAHQADIVSWNNTTPLAHWPWPTDKDFKPKDIKPTSPEYLSDQIESGQSSDAYSLIMPKDVDPKTGIGTIYYCCALHEDEHGTIEVRPVKTAPPAPPPTD